MISIPANALPGWALSSVHVRTGGAEIAVEQNAESLRFIALPNESPYSTERVYRLTSEATSGLRAPLPAVLSQPFAWERDDVYQPLVASERGDRWFALELRTEANPTHVPLAMPSAAAPGSSVQLSIATLVRRAEHRLAVFIDGQPHGQVVWSDSTGAGARTLSLVLPNGLAAGTHTLTLGLVSAGAPADTVLVDRIALPGAPVPLPELALPPLTHPSTHDFRLGTPAGAPGADLLIITHHSLQPALGPLVAAHEARGEGVAIVDAQAAYDAWSFAERSPEAIRQLIRTARQHWRPAPSSVLLVGAGSVRMREGDDTRIPPFLLDIDPKYGEIACDTCYTRLQTADVRDQIMPDLPIGRLPARTLAEAHALVAKTVAALSPPPGRWRNTAIALADNDRERDGTPDSAGSFVATAERALTLAPQLQATRLYYAPGFSSAAPLYDDVAALRNRLFSAWDDGAALAIYAGHASPWQYAYTEVNAATPHLLDIYDVERLGNGQRLPILLSLTCLSGNWANPTAPALDERLLLHASGGSAASLSPAGSGVNSGHTALLDGLLPALVGPQRQSLGAAHLAGLRTLAATGRNLDLAFSYNLLGDPEVTLPEPATLTFLPFVTQ